MRPARIYLGTPIRTYKCTYKGPKPARLSTPPLTLPARTPNQPTQPYIYMYIIWAGPLLYQLWLVAPARSDECSRPLGPYKSNLYIKGVVQLVSIYYVLP